MTACHQPDKDTICVSKLRPTNHLELLSKSIPNGFKTQPEAEKFLATPEAKGMIMEKLSEDYYVVAFKEKIESMKAEREKKGKDPEGVRKTRFMLEATGSMLGIAFSAMKDMWNGKYNELRQAYDAERNKYPALFKDKRVERNFEAQMDKALNSLSYLHYKDVKIIIFPFGEVLFRLNEARTEFGWRGDDTYTIEFRIQFLKTKKRKFTVRFNCQHHTTHKIIFGSGTVKSAIARLKKALDWEDNRIHKDAQNILAYIEDFGWYGKLYIHSEKKLSKPVGDFCKQLHYDMIQVDNCNNWKKKRIKENIVKAEAVLATLQTPEPDDVKWMEGIITSLKAWYANYSKKKYRRK